MAEYVAGEWNTGNVLASPIAGEQPGINLYLNGMVLSHPNFIYRLIAMVLDSIPMGFGAMAAGFFPFDLYLQDDFFASKVATTGRSNYRMSLSFYDSIVEAFEGNIEAACVGSAAHGAVQCGGIKYDSETDGEAWGQYISYEDFQRNQSMLNGVAERGWVNASSAELPNSAAQSFTVYKYQAGRRENFFGQEKMHWNNLDWRVDVDCEDCEAWYYTHTTDGFSVTENIKSLGSFVFMGASELAAGAVVATALTLAF